MPAAERRRTYDPPVAGSRVPPLDDIDRQLVLELQHDGRASYARLAEVVGMSQAAVRSRVQRLLESGALQIAAVADPFAFGFSVTAMVGVTCTGDLYAVGEELKAIEAVHFVVLTAGRYDCIAELVCIDTDHLLRVVNDRVRAIPGVREVDVITYLKLLKQWQPEFVRARQSDATVDPNY
jgi:Lrp/AsnC family transcriptional regulator for asnA, asnC and gidA